MFEFKKAEDLNRIEQSDNQIQNHNHNLHNFECKEKYEFVL